MALHSSVSATLLDQYDLHNWTVSGQAVTQLLIDPGSFRIQLWNLRGVLEIRMGVPFRISLGDAEQVLDPELSTSLAPALVLLGRTLTSLVVHRSGRLELDFGEDGRIEVDPHDAYEAWEICGEGVFDPVGLSTYACRLTSEWT